MWVHLLSSGAEPKVLVFTTKATVKVWRDVLSIVLTNLLIRTVCGLWFGQATNPTAVFTFWFEMLQTFWLVCWSRRCTKCLIWKQNFSYFGRTSCVHCKSHFFYPFCFSFEKCSFQSLLNSCSVGKYENESRVVILQSQRPLRKPDNIPSSTWLELLYLFFFSQCYRSLRSDHWSDCPIFKSHAIHGATSHGLMTLKNQLTAWPVMFGSCVPCTSDTSLPPSII